MNRVYRAYWFQQLKLAADKLNNPKPKIQQIQLQDQQPRKIEHNELRSQVTKSSFIHVIAETGLNF